MDNNVEDDDPFGLGQISQRAPPSTQAPRPPPEEDDILGDLGKPVSEATAAARRRESGSRSKGSTPKSISPHDKALAELVDMGFDAKRARQALLKTGDKSDVQAAVGILLTQAHQDSRKESQPGNTTERRNSESARRSRRGSEQGAPPWMRKTPTQETPQSPGERDVSQYASELGNSLFKSANTLWKTGQKRMQKAIAEFQHEGDSSQPRWMREAQLQSPEGAAPPGESSNLGGPRKVTARAEDLTNEAMMLDMNKRSTSGIKQNGHLGKDKLPRRDSDQARPRQPPLGVPVTADTRSRSIPSSASSRQIEKLSRQAVDDQSSQAYISPARRKKAPPKPSEPESSLDIFSTEPAPSQTPVPTSEGVPKKQPASSHRTPTPIQSRPTPPTRSIPSVSPNILSASASHREIGSAAFKRGDYASAHTSYTAALQGIPNSHPMTIVLRCNRALTALKTGDAKVAVTDADAALSSIGPSQGEGETIAVDKGENEKPMRDFFGKALMRKAEALEHTEKWKEAASVWREAVQSGHGGSVAIQGRNRCEKAAAPPQSKNTASATVVKQSVPAKKPLPRAAASMVASLNRPAKESEAVSRLRAANAAASAASDEAFALTDNVEARLGSWKAGKSDNLRALLGSLDTVLWENAGWRKVGMADLVMPNRVKVVYMKAIGKVHPDKVCLSPSSVFLRGEGMFKLLTFSKDSPRCEY